MGKKAKPVQCFEVRTTVMVPGSYTAPAMERIRALGKVIAGHKGYACAWTGVPFETLAEDVPGIMTQYQTPAFHKSPYGLRDLFTKDGKTYVVVMHGECAGALWGQSRYIWGALPWMVYEWLLREGTATEHCIAVPVNEGVE